MKNMIAQSPVTKVHPFDERTEEIYEKLSFATSVVPDEYSINAIGRTISFAGSPRRKASNIVPSRPISLPNGLKNLIKYWQSATPEIVIFDKIQIAIPVGNATTAARSNTKIVRFKSERMII